MLKWNTAESYEHIGTAKCLKDNIVVIERIAILSIKTMRQNVCFVAQCLLFMKWLVHTVVPLYCTVSQKVMIEVTNVHADNVRRCQLHAASFIHFLYANKARSAIMHATPDAIVPGATRRYIMRN